MQRQNVLFHLYSCTVAAGILKHNDDNQTSRLKSEVKTAVCTLRLFGRETGSVTNIEIIES